MVKIRENTQGQKISSENLVTKELLAVMALSYTLFFIC